MILHAGEGGGLGAWTEVRAACRGRAVGVGGGERGQGKKRAARAQGVMTTAPVTCLIVSLACFPSLQKRTTTWDMSRRPFGG